MALIILLFISFLASFLYLSSPLLNYNSTDLVDFVFKWYMQAQHDGFSYIKTTSSDYPPLYLYIIWALTYIPLKRIFAIKAVSIIFNFLTAIFVYKIVSCKYGKDSFLSLIAYGVIIFSPTVFLNSVMWGQTDSIIAFFSIAALYLLIKNNDSQCFIYSLLIYAIGISFKLQPIFLFPVFLLVLWERKESLYYLLIIPFTYILTIIPALFAGRGVLGLISLTVEYFGHRRLRLPAQNIYQWLPSDWKMIFVAGSVLCLLFVILIVIKVGKYRSQRVLSGEMIIRLALFFSILIPFLLPGMWNRYFFLADILSIIYAFYFPKFFYVPLLVNVSSFITYLDYLFFIDAVPFAFLTALNFVALIIVGLDIIKSLPVRSTLQFK